MDRRFVWFGESAFLVEPLHGEDGHALATALRALPGVEDVVPGSRILVRTLIESVEDPAAALSSIAFCDATVRPTRVVEVPVWFEGPDLEEVASASSTTSSELIGILLGIELEVEYLGFSPGFAYMTGLPAALRSIPRRTAPRTSVPAGSVAIAGGYLGIYPQASPGGWNVVGRTNMVMFDPETPPYASLQPGDRVRLVSSDTAMAPARTMGSNRPISDSLRRVVIERSGTLTTLQDYGRRGVGHLGVPRAGPVDPDLMRLANRVAGNPEDAGVLETTFEGPSLLFTQDSHVAVMGAPVAVAGRRLDPGAVVPVRTGDLLEVGSATSLHGYVAVAGGIRGHELFRSCSSDLLSGLGIGALRAGDELGLGEPGHPRGYAVEPRRTQTVRLLPGPDAWGDVLDDLVSAEFEVATDSNRVGVRLRGRQLAPVSALSAKASYGMIEGAVQLPPSGEPIVLLCDHATMGGYPAVATVISADIGCVAQRRPGTAIRFELVGREEALLARREIERLLLRSTRGTFPTNGI